MDGDVAAMRAAEGERIARERMAAPEVEMRGKDEEAGEGEEARRLEMEQQHLAEDEEVNSAHRSDDELDYSYSSGDDDKSDMRRAVAAMAARRISKALIQMARVAERAASGTQGEAAEGASPFLSSVEFFPEQ